MCDDMEVYDLYCEAKGFTRGDDTRMDDGMLCGDMCGRWDHEPYIFEGPGR